MPTNYMPGVIKIFEYYKSLGEKTLDIFPEEKINWQFNEESNSMSTIVKHITGNMLSRFTDFLTTDGEKEWRNREDEFRQETMTKKEVMERWNDAWTLFFSVLNNLTEEDLDKTVYIRNMGQTVTDALNRQVAHYAYHIGQMVYIGKMVMDREWKSLSIPKGGSADFNAAKFLPTQAPGKFL
jgi:uncharacterized damage-inducible protein DinB